MITHLIETSRMMGGDLGNLLIFETGTIPASGSYSSTETS